MGRRLVIVAAVLVGLLAAGCSGLIRNAARPVMSNVVLAVMKQRDVELVRQAAPAYMVMLDGLAEGSPDDPETLVAASQLYSAYAGAFLLGQEKERARLLTGRARFYAIQAASHVNDTFARLHDKPAGQFAPAAAAFGKGDEPLLLALINAWAGYIQARSESFDALADLPKIELLARRLLEIDETYYYGAGHLVMGVLKSLLPPAMGGRPEEARKHFERAMEISNNRLLSVQVTFAARYARGVYDRELHDRLLKEVLAQRADRIPELTLINTLAKREAEKLLAGADEYF